MRKILRGFRRIVGAFQGFILVVCMWIKYIAKKIWERQDLLLCLATVIVVGYATFWTWKNGELEGKEVWCSLSLAAGLAAAMFIGKSGYRMVFRYAMPLYLFFCVIHLFQRKPMIASEFETTLKNLFLRDQSAEGAVELILVLLTALVIAAFEARTRLRIRKAREERRREKNLKGRRARRTGKRTAGGVEQDFVSSYFPCIFTGITVLVMLFSYLFSGFAIRVVCISVIIFVFTVYTASVGRKCVAIFCAFVGFLLSFRHELAILNYNKTNGSYFLKWMAQRVTLPNILIWDKFELIGYCTVVFGMLSLLWFIWEAWQYADRKKNVCDEIVSMTVFVHFALAGVYFVAEMAFPDGNYFWGNNLPFFTGTFENNVVYLTELGMVYRILRKRHLRNNV